MRCRRLVTWPPWRGRRGRRRDRCRGWSLRSHGWGWQSHDGWVCGLWAERGGSWSDRGSSWAKSRGGLRESSRAWCGVQESRQSGPSTRVGHAELKGRCGRTAGVRDLAVSLKAGVQESSPVAQELQCVTSGLREAARELREAARWPTVGLAQSRCFRGPRGATRHRARLRMELARAQWPTRQQGLCRHKSHRQQRQRAGYRGWRVVCDWWHRSPLVQQRRGCARARWPGGHTRARVCGVRAKREMLWNITERRSRASPMGDGAPEGQRESWQCVSPWMGRMAG